MVFESGQCTIFAPFFMSCNNDNTTITVTLYNSEYFCNGVNQTSTFPVGKCVKHPYTKNTFMYVCCEDNNC